MIQIYFDFIMRVLEIKEQILESATGRKCNTSSKAGI